MHFICKENSLSTSRGTSENEIVLILHKFDSNPVIEVEDASILIETFIKQTTAKKSQKNAQTTSLSKITSNPLIVETVLNHLKSAQSHCDIALCELLITYLQLTKQFQDVHKYMNNLLPLFCLYFKGFVQEAEKKFSDCQNVQELFSFINNIIKLTIAGLGKEELKEVYKDHSFVLISTMSQILNVDHIGFDIKVKAALLLVKLLNNLEEDQRQHFVNKENPALDLLNQSNVNIDNVKLENFMKTDSVKVVIYSAIFNTFNSKSLETLEINNKPLAVFMYSELINCSKNSTGNPAEIIEITQTLSLISKYLMKINQDHLLELYRIGLEFIWAHLDHFIDTVRNYTKIFLGQLTKLALIHSKAHNREFESLLIEAIKKTSFDNTIRLNCFECIAQHFGTGHILEHFKNLPEELAFLLMKETTSEQVYKTYCILMQESFKENNLDIWLTPIVKKMRKKDNLLLQNLISEAFKLNPNVIKMFEEGAKTPQEICILLKCLKTAKFKQLQIKEPSERVYLSLIEIETLESFEFHPCDEVRLSLLTLIVSSQKTTNPFTEWELKFILNFFNYNITTQNPSVRKRILDLYQKAFSRYQASLAATSRKTKSSNQYYITFLEEFIKMLIKNLTINSNFSRRTCSLELLISTHSCDPTLWQSCWTPLDIQNCLTLINDSFECNKRMAVIILNKLQPIFTDCEQEDWFKKALLMANDLRPSKTLSAAYMLDIINTEPIKLLTALENKLKEKSSFDLLNVRSSHYGLILSIRHLIEKIDKNENYSNLFKSLVSICFEIKKDIFPVVSNCAPEGFIPENADFDSLTSDSSKAQMILVYAWRTMKELTLLLAEIVRQTIQSESEFLLIEKESLKEIGESFVEIFIESKHRGVFEQAFVGFSSICQSFWMSKMDVNELPKQWLKAALDLCTGKELNDKLCATRRSAGLPFLILAILTTENSFDKANFHLAMKTLLNCCETSPEPEFRTHSLNVLRALFRHSKLGELVSIYISQAAIIAIKGFKSNLWNVRNSSTLLYASLMTRIFGVQRTQDSQNVSIKNRLTIRVFRMRFPDLFKFLFETLKEECDSKDSLILHPVLMILARLYPSHLKDNSFENDEYLEALNTCLKSIAFRTRELSARAAVSVITKEQASEIVEAKLDKIKKETDSNEIHGSLLLIDRILDCYDVTINFDRLLENCQRIINSNRYGFLVTSTLLNVLLKLIQTQEVKDLSKLKNLAKLIAPKATNQVQEVAVDKYYLKFILFITIRLISSKESFEIASYYTLKALKGYGELKRFTMEFLIGLHESKTVHPLYELEELKISEEVKDLVRTFTTEGRIGFLRQIHSGLVKFLSDSFNDSMVCLDRVMVLILTGHYPCVLKKIDDNQKVLNKLLDLTSLEEEVSCVIYCLESFFSQLNEKELIKLDLDNLFNHLMYWALPSSSDYVRLALSRFIINNKRLFSLNISEELLWKLFMIVLVLLEDEESIVRTEMAKISNAPFGVTPEKCSEEVFLLLSYKLSTECALNFLICWRFRCFEIEFEDKSEIFERSKINSFADLYSNDKFYTELIRKTISKSSQELKDLLTSSLTKYNFPFIQNESKLVILKFIENANLDNLQCFLDELQKHFDRISFNVEFCKV